MKNIAIILLLNIITTSSKAELTTHSILNNVERSQVDYNILFIGNSLTYSNNLPRLVGLHAATKGVIVNTEMVAKANYAIVDHWADGQVQRLIKSQEFDFVVIQQGPSSQQNGYDMLVNDGAQYAQLCEENSSKLAYFMVWPSIAYYYSFDGVIRNYTAGAHENNAILIPVGSIWKQYIDATGDYSYYGSDGFHPSSTGSQKAAEIIVETLLLTSDCLCKSSDAPKRK